MFTHSLNSLLANLSLFLLISLTTLTHAAEPAPGESEFDKQQADAVTERLPEHISQLVKRHGEALAQIIVEEMAQIEGNGIGQLLYRTRDWARAFRDEIDRELSPEDVALVENALLSANMGDAVSESIGQLDIHFGPAVIEELQRRLQRSGLPIDVAPANDQEDTDDVLPQHRRAYNQWLGVRTSVAVLVGATAAMAGGWNSESLTPAIVTAGWIGFLEWQFGTFSKVWDKYVWSRGGVPASIAANVGYGTSAAAVLSLAESLVGVPVSFDANAFMQKNLSVTTSLFVLGFGWTQIIISQLKKIGYLSEYTRYVIEAMANLFNNAGRGVALGAAAAGLIQAGTPVFIVDGVPYYVPDLIGYGMMGSFALAVTIPLVLKRSVGDKKLDYEIKQYLDLREEKPQTGTFLNRSCKAFFEKYNWGRQKIFPK